jgi:membrane protein DedA with SNARE-associated domain
MGSLLWIMFFFMAIITGGLIWDHKRTNKKFSIARIIIGACFLVDSILVIIMISWLT